MEKNNNRNIIEHANELGLKFENVYSDDDLTTDQLKEIIQKGRMDISERLQRLGNFSSLMAQIDFDSSCLDSSCQEHKDLTNLQNRKAYLKHVLRDLVIVETVIISAVIIAYYFINVKFYIPIICTACAFTISMISNSIIGVVRIRKETLLSSERPTRIDKIMQKVFGI